MRLCQYVQVPTACCETETDQKSLDLAGIKGGGGDQKSVHDS